MEHNDIHDGTSRRDVLKIGGLTALGSAVAGAIATSGSASASVKNAASVLGSRALREDRFSFEIDGVAVAGIHTVDIESDASVVNDPASPSFNTVVITRDWSTTSTWFTWRKSVLDGKVDRKSISVIFHSDAGQEAGRLNFYQCWPSKWTGPSLNARNSAHATEKLELSWETVELK